MPQPLASKEASLFRQVVKNFESKQHKKGLKAAEQILRKVPNHGDTEAMKALLLNATGHSEEAFALAKVALTHDMKSHVCWHVYGLLWRSAKNFDEAIKAYRFALKLEPESAQIQRDLALLQIQMRDYQGYIQSRKAMVLAKPNVRQNWTALAVAYHLAGDLPAAESTLKAFEDSLKSPPSKNDIEHSEAVLYRNTIIAEMGETERALEHLEVIAKSNLDRSAVMEMRAQYLLQLGRKEQAAKAYRDLLARNPEYRLYFEGLEQSLGLERSDTKGLKEMYHSYAQNHDRIDAASRIPLDFLEGDEFRQAADQYLRYMLTKGVPSTFNNIKALYGNEQKRRVVQDLVEGYLTEKAPNGSTNGDGKPDASQRYEEAVLYFLAQHYNYKPTRQLKKAMELTKQLLTLNPTKYDYQMMKARVLKHQGNPLEAATAMDQARNMDLKDRYINTKCAKYQLRNNDNETALQTMSKFTKNDIVGGTLGDLVDMQVIWYLTEDGEAYARKGMTGLALKRFHTIYNIFDLWQEDQFDFHAFSFRKGQIRAYVDMVRWEDQLRAHPFYTRMAIGAIKTYLEMYDTPQETANGVSGSEDSDKKKALKKAKKEQEKAEREDAERREADKKAAAKKGNTTSEGEQKKPDPDPRGTKLLETRTPLQDAMKFLTPLLEFGSENIEAQHLGGEVYLRRQKPFLALKCILAAFHIDNTDPTAQAQTLRLLQALNTSTKASSPSTPIEPVLQNLLKSLPEPYAAINPSNATTSQLIDLAKNINTQNPSSLEAIYASSIACQWLDPSSRPTNAISIIGSLDTLPPNSADDPRTALRGIETLKELFRIGLHDHSINLSLAGEQNAALKTYVEKALKLWPDAAVSISRAADIES